MRLPPDSAYTVTRFRVCGFFRGRVGLGPGARARLQKFQNVKNSLPFLSRAPFALFVIFSRSTWFSPFSRRRF